ncbi:hypothetical protein C8F01DRAFT_1114796 [Mycena amicta]|nr:hypothetical protein C8F01DRAFT_1114796 [Mycena amicta]
MLGLLALAILMHRIQNIVVPPSSSNRSLHHSRGRNLVQRLWNSLLPLDLTRTSTRLAFQLPTLLFLLKQLFIWTAILLQTSDLFPSRESGYIWSYIWSFGQWTQSLEMEDVCFRTFTSICAAFAMESFVRGLDGGGLGLVQINANSSPFNLIGYSFLLHIYASPITHVYKPPGLPSRPDKHVIVSITIPLLQLTIFHILSIRKRWSNHRLLPTALSSALALVHFHSTLYAHYVAASPAPPLSVRPPDVFVATTVGKFPAPTPPPLVNSPGPLYSRPTGSASVPLLNYVPHTFETLLVLTIALTVVLNALTQLILTGRVSRPLLGLGLTGGSANGAWAWAPPYDEDWGVVLLRVGIASLEATGLRGWGNELPGVNAAPLQRFPQYGMAKMGPSGIVEVSSGFGSTNDGNKFRKRGLANEVKEVDVGAPAGNVFGARLVNWRWLKEAWRFVITMCAVGRGLVRAIWRYALTGGKAWDVAPNGPLEGEGEEEAETNEGEDQALYDRFLRQEEISDDDGEVAEQWDLAESSEDDDGGNEDGVQDNETIGIYSDLAETTSAPMLLAHLTRTDDSPLTRRRYGALVQSGPSEVPEASIIPLPRHAPQPEDESRRNCVICTVDARDVICWPCRCLSMCDGCREVLASRASASKHRCPCCREVVKGYSRIFIP